MAPQDSNPRIARRSSYKEILDAHPVMADKVKEVDDLRAKLDAAELELRQLERSSPPVRPTLRERQGTVRSLHNPFNFSLQQSMNPNALVMSAATYNKDTAFTTCERQELRLTGLLPARVETLEEQVARARKQLDSFDEPINKYIFLASTAERNETVFYRLVVDHIFEYAPFIYTPTVGQACLKFGNIWRSSRGLYINQHEAKGRIADILENWPADEVAMIVVTDGSRILGLGDLGVNGMGIPIGKLALYVAGAGFHPSRTLPVMLDVGTNNEALRNSPDYLGLKQERCDDDTFYALVEEFMTAVKRKWPHCLVQFEDFSNNHCFDLLEKYRHRQLCFNDDIQGTGAVILSGFLNASKAMGLKPSEQKLLFYGAGSAAVGVADQIVAALQLEGLSAEEARARCFFVDSKGLVSSNRGDKLAKHKVAYAREEAEQPITLLDCIKYVRPTGLIGLSGQGGSFHEDHVRLMGSLNEKPIIFALSNPTKNAEVSFENAIKWTNGRVIFASGSPFDPVEHEGHTYYSGQGNNMYIFPGLGFGSFLCSATEVTDEMVIAAARTLADLVPDADTKKGILYPALSDIREISVRLAVAVIEKAYEQGVAQLERPSDVEAMVRQNVYAPEYK